MRSTMFMTIAALTAATVSASVARAQKPVTLGIAAGAALPMSNLRDTNNVGFNGTVTLGLSAPTLPIGFRIDGAYNQFGFKSGLSGNLHAASITGNAVYTFPALPVQPYIIGGLGLYNVNGTVNGVSGTSESDFGFNAGAGIKLPLSGFDTFLEARYNRVTLKSSGAPAMQFIPITFGVMF